MQKNKDLLTIIILSENGNPPKIILDAAKNFENVYLLFPPNSKPLSEDSINFIPACKPVPELLNEILKQSQTEFITVINEDVELIPQLPEFLGNVPVEKGLIYGDYHEVSRDTKSLKQAYSGPEDITERADLGPLVIFRNTVVNRLGGWEESLKYSYDYELRLKMGESDCLHYVPQPLCKIKIQEQNDDSANKLFFPGKGKYGGFSYLFMEPEEEQEIETVFADSLKRRGAYLDGEAPGFNPEASISPLVTVITPVYNREKFIGKAIESVLSGEFEDFEYIIIDNGSTDNTVDIVKSYESDPRIKLIKNPVNRIAISLNIGLQNAKGKYISQLDSDDLYTPATLKSMSDFMEETNCGLAISYYSLIDEDGNDLPEFGIIEHLEYSRNNIMRVDGAGAVRMWRKSAMLEFGGFDAEKLVDYGEDYDLVLKMGEKYSIGRVHEVLYKYRRHPDNSDILRDPIFKLRNKNLARERAIARRRKMNQK